MIWKPELDELARREAFAREMGGVDKVKRQRDQGRLTVRERIDKLVDPESFHEVGAISGVAEYDEKRIHKEAAPRMLDLAAAVGALLEGDGDIFANRLERKSLAVPAHNNKKVMTEETNGLEAGARRPRPARSVRAGDGRR